ncbi:hypothetical protein ACLB1N_01255 [Escherichia coli]
MPGAKIHDVHARAPTYITTEALQRIGELYAIEAEAPGPSSRTASGGKKSQSRATDAVTV